MNQILQMENKKDNKPIEIGKILKFFGIAIIIFAIVLLGVGIYYLVINNSNEIQEEKIPTKPNVNIEKQDENVLIEVNGDIEISKIIYKWNEEEEVSIDGQNRKKISETIELPYGTNTLNLTVIDINGVETKFQKEYVVEENGAKIELTLTKDYKIKIQVQDENGLKYINYSWNNEPQTKVDADTEDQKTLEQIVEIPLGQNTLKVEAINSNDIISTKELEIRGVKKPNLSFKKQGDSLIIKAEDEVGMKTIDYTLNGNSYHFDGENKKVIEINQAVEKGENSMEITVENQDGGITTKKVIIKN